MKALRITAFLTLFFCPLALCHPMDMGAMEITMVWNQMRIKMELHENTVMKLLSTPRIESELSQSAAEALFAATLAQKAPSLSGTNCHWKNPSLKFKAEDKTILQFFILADCAENTNAPFLLDFPLPFLLQMEPSFNLAITMQGKGPRIVSMANKSRPQFIFDPNQSQGLFAFLRMGMGHIGALPKEWINSTGGWHLPEGLDHIFFVMALVLSGGSLLGLIKSVSGFTIGHSLTLGLTALQIIHIHSRWVEVFIALSIVYMASMALVRSHTSQNRWSLICAALKPCSSAYYWLRHRRAPGENPLSNPATVPIFSVGFLASLKKMIHWAASLLLRKSIVAMLFGTVHGLGFASALQELDLTRAQMLPALVGFNIGVEMGQLIVIACLLFPLWLIKKNSLRLHLWVHHSIAAGIFLIGSYWAVLRIVN